MSGEVWAIVGVVVGAVLGGGAQIVADRLNRAEARRQRTRERRHAAYVELLDALHECIRIGVKFAGLKEPTVPVELSTEIFQALERATAAESQVLLVAPSDTHAAAAAVTKRAGMQMGKRKFEDPIPNYAAERDAFVKLAKRDLGLD